ncbi:hypothetical protein NECAME_19108 [Necator americanus]|uniref:Uncharacterized protein n=1 Tax=Necator americanus TaxID=51031 RepID=W2SSU7_NECAM|nr:hypothetical protein NECAME_19108 [Necator americanus]ETN71921.1 hypothetical protein NECAME_19108 [Necator americanus]
MNGTSTEWKRGDADVKHSTPRKLDAMETVESSEIRMEIRVGPSEVLEVVACDSGRQKDADCARPWKAISGGSEGYGQRCETK